MSIDKSIIQQRYENSKVLRGIPCDFSRFFRKNPLQTVRRIQKAKENKKTLHFPLAFSRRMC